MLYLLPSKRFFQLWSRKIPNEDKEMQFEDVGPSEKGQRHTVIIHNPVPVSSNIREKQQSCKKDETVLAKVKSL